LQGRGNRKGRKGARIRAVTFDAFGTLITLESPFERLQEGLLQRGVAVPMEVVRRVLREEMAFYKVHHLEGSDPQGLLRLRRRCARMLLMALKREGYPTCLSPKQASALLMRAMVFRVYEDALAALQWCWTHGLKTAVVSNWDLSLPRILHRHLPYSLDECPVVVSALEGVGKERPGPYLKASRLLGLDPSRMLHVGDDWAEDVLSARKAGCLALHLDREGKKPRAPWRIRTLGELPLKASIL